MWYECCLKGGGGNLPAAWVLLPTLSTELLAVRDANILSVVWYEVLCVCVCVGGGGRGGQPTCSMDAAANPLGRAAGHGRCQGLLRVVWYECCLRGGGGETYLQHGCRYQPSWLSCWLWEMPGTIESCVVWVLFEGGGGGNLPAAWGAATNPLGWAAGCGRCQGADLTHLTRPTRQPQTQGIKITVIVGEGVKHTSNQANQAHVLTLKRLVGAESPRRFAR